MKWFKTILTVTALLAAFPVSVRAELPAASTPAAEAYVTDYTIELDGSILKSTLPVLNYNDRTYTPARLIAEAMGATVEFDEMNGRVIITGPEPTIVEIIKEVTVEVPVYLKNFSSIPVSQTKNRLACEISEIVRSSDATYVYATVENNNLFFALLKYRDFYIEADGVKYYSADNFTWANSLNPSGGSLSGFMIFDPIPSDAERFTVVIPFTLQNADTLYTFEFDIEL